jgi:2-phosphosulfolactate phosphatase
MVGDVLTEIRHLDDVGPANSADAVVVVDVFRAFTTAPWCYEAGARSVLLASTIEEALASRVGDHVLLIKDGLPDPRFDLQNAPGLVAETDLGDRTVVQITGNGTRGVYAVSAPHVLCASFVTAGATARFLRQAQIRSVLFVPTEGDEDTALADYLVELLHGDDDPTDFLCRAEASPAAAELRQRGPDPAFPGVHPNDLTRCLELDRFDFALEAIPQGVLRKLERR